MTKTYIGIDLGTTNTTCGVAVLSADGSITCRRLPIPQPQIAKTDAGKGKVSWNHSENLPSAVWLAEGNNVYTGAVCVEYADLISMNAGSRVVHGIKSELANRHWALQHNGQTYKPAEISSCLLRTVWDAVRSQSLPQIDGIIITIPSSFSSTMRRETLRAARMAGLPMDKVSLLDEPIAALFSEYGDADDPFRTIQTKEPILVFDMGGGTVDVTILSVRPDERVVDVHSTSRYNQVAGDDLDLEIAAYLWRRLKSVIGNVVPTLSRASALALLRAGEAVKLEANKVIKSISNGNALALRDKCRIRNYKLYATFDLSLDVSETPALSIPIADVLDLVLPFISLTERERNYDRNIFTPIVQALKRAGLQPETIRQVYLVGGGANFQPVYLELHSYFHSLSRALDPSYSVSTGAARFAAAASSGWRVSESTSERIYVRRNGESFLEVLPEKLPIPSQPTVPPLPLVGNDTIEFQEESRYLRLEFFQGSQANDPQMSPVYTATLRFRVPLMKGTVVDSIVGRIDKNKIYQFELGFTAPNQRKVSSTVEFSADADAQTTSESGPQYHLNNLASLVTLLQRESLLRARLNARLGTSRATFLSQAAPSVAEKLTASEESLLAERNALLQAMNESWDDAYMGDKYLPARMRATLQQLQNLRPIAGAASEILPHLELVTLYKQYGAVVIRSLLDHCYLLYGTHDLEPKLGPVVDSLTDDLSAHPERVRILLADLNHYSDSPFDVARNLVEIFLKAAGNVPGIHELILTNAAFGVPFKLMAARVLGDPQDAPSRLLQLLTQQLAIQRSADEFNWKVRPIIAALAATEADGFELAMGAFDQGKLGHAGALVLGSFGETFYKWAVHKKALSPRYVPALFQALKRIRSRVILEDLIRRLVDQWSLDKEVARKADEGFEKLRGPRLDAIRGILSDATRKMLDDRVPSRALARDWKLIRKIREAAVKRNRRYLHSLPCDEPLGDAIADVLASDIDDSVAAFLLEFSTKGNDRFLRHLLERLLRRHPFETLSESRQRLILEKPVTERIASIRMLEGIKEGCKPALHPFVTQMIFEKYQAAKQ